MKYQIAPTTATANIARLPNVIPLCQLAPTALPLLSIVYVCAESVLPFVVVKSPLTLS